MIPSPHRLQVRRYSASTQEDAMGEVTAGLGAPQDWWVRSVDPVTQREPSLPNRDLSNIVYVIQADKTPQVPSYRDVVLINGIEYSVDGAPDDWTVGPWPNPVAGVTVYVKRTEG